MRIIKIASIFAGTVLGAGFASGQELWIFFGKFKQSGVWGALISGIMIALFGGIICSGAKEIDRCDYITYLKSIFFEPVAKVICFVTQVFMFISFSIMISGSCELMHTQFNIPRLLGGGITLFICFICLANKVSGIAKLNIILTPVMSIGIFLVSVCYSFMTKEVWNVYNTLESNFFVSACLYMSYNILSSAAVLATASDIAKSKMEALIGGFAGGLVLMLIMLFSVLALNKAGDMVLNTEFPMLIIAQQLQDVLKYIYPPLIYMAMLTTAVSSGFCACEFLEKLRFSGRQAAGILCIASVPLSMVRFSSLIKNCYILFGVLGIMLIAGITIKFLKKQGNSR